MYVNLYRVAFHMKERNKKITFEETRELKYEGCKGNIHISLFLFFF